MHYFTLYTEIRVSKAVKSSSYFVSSLFLYPLFWLSCNYVCNNISFSYAHCLESFAFPPSGKNLVVTLSLNTSVLHIYISHLILLCKILWMFNFQSGTYLNPFSLDRKHLGRFHCSQTALAIIFLYWYSGEQAFNFTILCDLDQLVQHPSHIPDHLQDISSIGDLFLTSNLQIIPSKFSLHWALPIIIFSIFCHVSPVPPLDPPKLRCFWLFL